MFFIACFSNVVPEWLPNDVNRKVKEFLIYFIVDTKFLMVKLKTISSICYLVIGQKRLILQIDILFDFLEYFKKFLYFIL